MAELTKEQYQQFLSLLSEGNAVSVCAQKMGVSHKTCYRVFKRDNLKIAPKPDPFSPEMKSNIIIYWQTHSNIDTRKHFNISENQMYDIIKEAGVKLKSSKAEVNIEDVDKYKLAQFYATHSYNETIEYFKISSVKFQQYINEVGLCKREKSFDDFLNHFPIDSFLIDYPNMASEELLNKYDISEAFYYKIVELYNLPLKKRKIITKEEFLSKVSKEDFIQYIKGHTIVEASDHFDVSVNLIESLSKELLGQRKRYKETTGQTIARILNNKNEFLQDYYTLSLDTLMYKWRIHSRRLPALEQALNIPHRQIKMEITQKTNKYKYGVPYACMRKEAKITHKNDSKPNLDFMKLLEQNHIKYEREFAIDKFSYDFKVGHILIEIDPSRTHSADVATYGRRIHKKYHKEKSETALKNGYRCIHIFEWENPEQIIRILTPNPIISLQECIIKEVDAKTAKDFVEKYHYQGFARNKIRIGAYYNNELVLLMTFNKARYNANYEWELVRYCGIAHIEGGAKALLDYFKNLVNPSSIITYCDLSKFDINTYEKLGMGFNKFRVSSPACHWHNHNTKQHITNNLLIKRGFDQLFGTHYGKEGNNVQLMLDAAFVRVYDCGQATYVWRKDIINETQNNISE